jgi:uncharacterized membrane protein (DUF2068 family)
MAEIDTETPIKASEPRSLWGRWIHTEHSRGLLLIGLFKLSKAVLSIALGVGALRMVHRDLGVLVLRISDFLRIDPESHLVGLVMDKADLVGSHQLRQFSQITFLYAALCLLEGTGLMLEKRWAEYFTLILTVLALPWECYELAMHFTSVRIVLLLINLAVLAYLIWLLWRKRQEQ